MALPCLTGEVKTVAITTAQLQLIAHALRHCYLDPRFTTELTKDQLMEIPLLATCCDDVATHPSGREMVHGIAL